MNISGDSVLSTKRETAVANDDVSSGPFNGSHPAEYAVHREYALKCVSEPDDEPENADWKSTLALNFVVAKSKSAPPLTPTCVLNKL